MFLLCAVLFLATLSEAQPVRVRSVEAELISENAAITGGQPFWLAVRLAMDPHWHTYWENPGDSGLATTIAWDLPEGFSAGPVLWPYPERFEAAPYVSYGYQGEVLLLSQITPPAELTAGNRLSLMGRADWTVCREDLCMPGGADLSVEIPVRADAPQPNLYSSAYFETTRARLPGRSEQWQVRASSDGENIKLLLTPSSPRDPGSVLVFERDKGLLDHSKPVAVARNGDRIEIDIPLSKHSKGAPELFRAVLVASRHWDSDGKLQALSVSAPVEQLQ